MTNIVRTKRQLMLDAHILGAIIRNLTALAGIAEINSYSHAVKVMDSITRRYEGSSPNDALNRINAELIEAHEEPIN